MVRLSGRVKALRLCSKGEYTLPLYTYSCEKCKAETEIATSMATMLDEIVCPCGGVAKRVIVRGHGGFQSDQPKWLDDAHKGLCDPKDPPFESRTEWKRHLKEKGVIERS